MSCSLKPGDESVAGKVLPHSATSGPSCRARNIRVVSSRNVGFTAMNLEPHLTHPGQKRNTVKIIPFKYCDYAIIQGDGSGQR